ncbi:MAG: hypothetical protein RLW87_07225 [Alphaproteobacteria bacterium]|uniref:hypothetical protein n=1 Tax=Pacificispira sp. TaxID=2888761 RepID=UPI0033004271
MGMLKTRPTGTGVDATYWMIGNINEDFWSGGAQLTLYGFKDEQAAQQKMRPLDVLSETFLGSDYEPDRSRADWYAILVTKPDWSGAEIV